MKYKKIIIVCDGKKYPGKLFSLKNEFILEFTPEVFMPPVVSVSFAEKSKDEG